MAALAQKPIDADALEELPAARLGPKVPGSQRMDDEEECEEPGALCPDLSKVPLSGSEWDEEV